MRMPAHHIADQLAQDWPRISVGPHRWYLARPEPGPGWLPKRLRLAWAVFTGRADALFWVNQ